MNSEVNLYKLEHSFIKQAPKQGYSLRIKALNSWKEKEEYTSEDIAKILNMTVCRFEYKLRKHRIFNKEQITDLIYFMGANSAFFVMYFPTFEERVRVYEEFFEDEMIISKRNQEEVWRSEKE